MVSWGTALVVTKPEEQQVDKNSLWTLISRPARLQDVRGNASSIQAVDAWFSERSTDSKSGILFVQGPCGVGKSLVVRLVCEARGFSPVDVAISESRTPKSLEAHMRASTMFPRGVVVLDEFESLAEDRAGLENVTRFLLSHVSGVSGVSQGPRALFVCMCSEPSDNFSKVVDKATLVNFEKLGVADTHALLQRANALCPVSVPPMDLYLMSSWGCGDARRLLNDFQMSYSHTTFVAPSRGKNGKKRKRVEHRVENSLTHICASSNAVGRPDTLSRNVLSGRATPEQCRDFVDNMGHDALVTVSTHLREYPKTFSFEGCVRVASAFSDTVSMNMLDVDLQDLDLSDSTVDDAHQFSAMSSHYAVGSACLASGSSNSEPVTAQFGKRKTCPKLARKIHREFQERRETESYLLHYTGVDARDYCFYENMIQKKKRST